MKNYLTILLGVVAFSCNNSADCTKANQVVVQLSKANCYIINATGSEQTFLIPVSQAADGIAAVNATGGYQLTFDPASDWTAEVLWQTWQATSTANQLGISRATVNNANDYIKVIVPSGIENGNNAVIALKDATGVILWSWHLWITDYNPSKTGNTAVNGELHAYSGDAFTSGIYQGKYIMDRNLGATWTGGTPSPQATAAEAGKAYGLLYQWGRKDPFTSPSGVSTTTAAPIYGGAIDSPALTEGTGTTFTGINRVSLANATDIPNNLANAVQNPTFFYFSGGENNDWYVGAGSGGSQNNALWGPDTKSVFDPCPVGYRVSYGGATATNNPWAGFANGNWSSTASALNSPALDNTPFLWYLDGVLQGAVGTGTGNPTTGRLFSNNGLTAWYPAFNGRYYASGALLGTSGSWSAVTNNTVNPANAYFLNFSNMFVGPGSNGSRGSGFTVRCIQE